MSSESLDFASGGAEPRLDGTQPIPISATTTAAFLGRTERGPLNEPVAVRSFDEYRRVFGGHCAYSFVSFAVQHFFQQGGESALVVRIANRATRASIAIPAGDDTLRLQARQPGSREFLRVSIDYDRVDDDPRRFNLVVQRLSRPGSQLVVDQELYQGLSMEQADERFVVDALQGSELVRLAGPLPSARPEATRPAHPGAPIPYLDMTAAGSDGDELTDYDLVGSNTEGTGLFALDRVADFDLLCIPPPPGRDLGTTTFVAATRYCERRRALLVWDPPWSWTSADAAVLGVRGSSQVSHNAMTYFPRIRLRGESHRFASGMPACGAVAGILARCDRGARWHDLPPAEAALKGNLTPVLDLQDRERGALHRHGVNSLVRVQGGASLLQGNVTFAGPRAVATLWQKLDVKRLTSFVVRSIERHTRWVFEAGEPAAAAAALERQVWIFLSRLQQRGAFAGANAEQAFFVRTGTRRFADRAAAPRPLVLRIGFAPLRPVEFLEYEFRYHPNGMITEAVPARDVEHYLG
jgi:hypothetical protein